METKQVTSAREEIANSMSHGMGVIGSLIAAPLLLGPAMNHGTVWRVAGTSVFVISMILVYLSSTLYHALPPNRAKNTFRVLDHCAIYVLIAGTYTPFLLGVLRGPWGWTLFGVVWGMALIGIFWKASRGIRHSKLSTAMYIAMGWIAVIAIRPLWLHVPADGLLWIFGGGIAYTAGVAFLGEKRFRYSHFAWHLFVLAGTTCHVFAVRWYSN